VAENELTFDERALATNLSKIFDTEHYEIVLQAPDIESSLPKLIWHLEDLRVGQSYPNYYAAKLASDHVKVVLSGTGGDELFAGYSWRYPQINSQASQSEYLQQQYLLWQRLISDKEKKTFFNSDCLLKMDEAHTYHIFKSIYNQWQAPLEAPTDFINASLYFELKTFLHGLLIVEDKLSMAHGLETRVPFLDNDLVEFALKIPASMKLAVQSDNKLTSADKRDNGKLILRQALSKLMPAEVLTRKKQGFSAPDASWFRNKNLNYIHQTLLNKKACLHEFISPNYVRTILDQHASGKINHRLLIWSLLSFEWWCRVFLMKECPNYDSNVFLD
jgi:asparagine synthase (glutamine-hydrolysing)